MTNLQRLRYIKNRCIVTSSGCWLWEGNTFSNGYGRFSAVHRKEAGLEGRVHVAVYRLKYGPMPEGKPYVCHKCDVKRCCAPNCLWPGTNKENQLDAAAKGVFARYWTEERRREKSTRNSGTGNPMYGRSGASAPCWGRRGSEHPMYGKRQKEESKARISASLFKFNKERRKKLCQT